MPAGQRIRGRDGVITLNVGVTTEEIPMLMSWTLDTSATFAEDAEQVMASNGDGGASVADNWGTSYLESKSFTFSTEHHWQNDSAIGTTGIADATNVGDRVAFELIPESSNANPIKYVGSAFIESVSIPSVANDKIKQSITFKGDGPLTKDSV